MECDLEEVVVAGIDDVLWLDPANLRLRLLLGCCMVLQIERAHVI